jgi:DinB superfamily
MTIRNKFLVGIVAVLYLAAVASAQTQASQNQVAAVPQAGSTTLTPQEREAAIKQFETTRDNFLKSIAGLSEKQWTFKPGPDRWSVAEVSEHIKRCNRRLLPKNATR